MYICKKCGKKYQQEICNNWHKTFPLTESAVFYNNHLSISGCECGGEIVKLSVCEKCGAETATEYCLCDTCMNEYKTLDTMLEIGGVWGKAIIINDFLLSIFDVNEIEQILIDTLKNCEDDKRKSAIENYYEFDKGYFKEHIERTWKKSKK